MNKRQVISSLYNIAEELDNNGLYVEAEQVTNVMRKIAGVTPVLRAESSAGMGYLTEFKKLFNSAVAVANNPTKLPETVKNAINRIESLKMQSSSDDGLEGNDKANVLTNAEWYKEYLNNLLISKTVRK
jgi:hypothetical protein